MACSHLPRLLLLAALFAAPVLRAADSSLAEPPSLPPAAGEVLPDTLVVEEEDPIGIKGLAQMSPSLQGCHKMLLRGDYCGALKRLDDLATKRLRPEELAAVQKMIDYAYGSGLEPQVKAIEEADPLKGLRLLNLFKPPRSPDFYAPKLAARVEALERKLRSPEAKPLQDAGREFEVLYEQYQTYPDEVTARLEAFVSAHANDPYGAMAARVLEGKTPVEEKELDVSGGGDLAEAPLLYPSEIGAMTGSVPKNGAELKKLCETFLAQSERVLKADTADAIECDAKFWKWVDARPNIRTGLLLAKNPVPPMYAINLAKCFKKFGRSACDKYSQLVLAGSMTDTDITIGGQNYVRANLSENQLKVGNWLAKNWSAVPLWRFYQDPKKYAAQAGGMAADLGDIGKMAFASRTYPPMIPCSNMDNLRYLITIQESKVRGVQWPLFPVARTPYILLNPIAINGRSRRERLFIWDLFNGRVGYPSCAEPGEQPPPPGKPQVGTTVGYGRYGFEYTRPDVAQRKSLWNPNTVVRMIEDGGVCGRMAAMCVIGQQMLGVPQATAGQPGHCALLAVSFNGKAYNAYIGQSVTGTWMNTGPHSALGISPAIAGHEHEAISWLALTQTVNRVGMENYHASLVTGYMADTASDPVERRRWLELTVRLNPYHLPAIEKIWQMAAEQGVNSLNRAMWETIDRMAVKKGKTMEDVVLGQPEHDIIRKLIGTHVAGVYDTALTRAGSVSGNKDLVYKTGEGYQEAELTDEQKALAQKAGLYDEKHELKDDLNLMYRYLAAFQKKDLLYGMTREIFLKHLSRVDPEIARKMLNDMLLDAIKHPIGPDMEDDADDPLLIVVTAISEMDSKLSPQDRAQGLTKLCNLVCKPGERVSAKGKPHLSYGQAVFLDEVSCNKAYKKAFLLLNKTLRECGTEGAELASRAEKAFDREIAKKQYECDVKNYQIKLGAYKTLLSKLHGRKANVGPPPLPQKPKLAKDGRVIKPGDSDYDGPAKGKGDSLEDRVRRGEGVTVN